MRLARQAAERLRETALQFPDHPELILQTVRYHSFLKKNTREDAEALVKKFVETAPDAASLPESARLALLELHLL